MFDAMSHGQVFLAQAGWDDTDEMVFQGDFDEGENTLVRCQLFSGRDITKEHTPDRAQGTKLICQIADGIAIPQKGAKVYLICPHGMDGVTGAYVIVASVTKQALRKNIESGSVVIGTPAGEACIVLKPDGSIVFHTTADNTPTGKSVFFRLSPDGFDFRSPFGSFEINAARASWNHHTGGNIKIGGISIPLLPSLVSDAFGGYITMSAPTVKIDGGTVFIGNPGLRHPAIVGPVINPPVPPKVLPDQYKDGADIKQSQSVYISL